MQLSTSFTFNYRPKDQLQLNMSRERCFPARITVVVQVLGAVKGRKMVKADRSSIMPAGGAPRTQLSFHVCKVMYQTRETVFHWDIQTPRRELKIRRAAEYF